MTAEPKQLDESHEATKVTNELLDIWATDPKGPVALHLKQRTALGNLEQLGIAAVRRHRTQMLFRPDHAHAKACLEQTVNRALVILENLQRQSLKQLARQIDFVDNDRFCIELEQPPDDNDGSAQRDLQGPRRLEAGLGAPALERQALRKRERAFDGYNTQKTEEGTRIIVRSNKGAFTLFSHKKVFGRHLIDGLAYGTLADVEANGQLGLARNSLAGAPFARCKSLEDQAFNLTIERTESG